jgi:hypothetical protein
LRNDPPKVPPSLSKSRQEYRIYCLDGVGHIHRSFEFHAKNDAEAIKIANAWREHGRAELWCLGRMVHKW